MDKSGRKISVGGVVKKNNTILLVKHNYGPTKGKWDFPRGYVELGESLEDAIIREVYEETSINSKPINISGIRNMLRIIEYNNMTNDVLIIWELEYISGVPIPDGREINETGFFNLDEILKLSNVGGWTKEIVTAIASSKGLSESKYSPSSHPEGTIYWKTYLSI